VHRLLASTAVEGPGRRAALWVQGCSIRCPGCFNPHTWSERGGRVVSVDEVAERIVATPDIEGVTFLGGEPFDQAAPLAALARSVGGLSVMTFTGHELEHLRAARRPDWDALLDATDLLVDGPYMRERPDRRRPWVGSTNQRFHFLTPRYAHLACELDAIPDAIEVRIAPDGTLAMNGMADRATIRALARAVHEE
jgi:anaerobic ribonucleoside-triphosphate reductase activating protein